MCLPLPWDERAGAFSVVNFKWNPDGTSMTLLDKNRFCIAFTANGLEAL